MFTPRPIAERPHDPQLVLPHVRTFATPVLELMYEADATAVPPKARAVPIDNVSPTPSAALLAARLVRRDSWRCVCWA